MTKDKATLFQRRGSDMIAGKVSGQTLRGTGTVHRHTVGEIPKGMTAIEEAIWKLE